MKLYKVTWEDEVYIYTSKFEIIDKMSGKLEECFIDLDLGVLPLEKPEIELYIEEIKANPTV